MPPELAFSLGKPLKEDSASLIVNVLPQEVNIEKIEYKYDVGGVIRVTDGSDWYLDLSHL